MGDYFDDDDLIGMDEDFDEEPPPEMFGGGGGPSATAGSGTSGPAMEEFDEDYLAMIEEDMANGGGDGGEDAGPTHSGHQEPLQGYGESGFAQDGASASTGFDGPPRVIVADPLKNEQESAAAREKRLYGFER